MLYIWETISSVEEVKWLYILGIRFRVDIRTLWFCRVLLIGLIREMVLWQRESAIVRIDNDETMLSSLFDERSLSCQLN